MLKALFVIFISAVILYFLLNYLVESSALQTPLGNNLAPITAIGFFTLLIVIASIVWTKNI